jgi:hypothetical protein
MAVLCDCHVAIVRTGRIVCASSSYRGDGMVAANPIVATSQLRTSILFRKGVQRQPRKLPTAARRRRKVWVCLPA